MKKYTYVGQKYNQGHSSQRLITFCASANDIFEWGGVPQKTDRFDGGFQRALDKRYKKIIKFFDDGQVSPTAVVVAFREGALSINPLGYPSSWPQNDTLATSPEFVQINFELKDIDTENASLDDLIKDAKDLLSKRLAQSIPSEDPKEDEQEESTSEDSSDSDTENDEEEEDEMESLDVGHSKLTSFYNFISDKTALNKWLSAEKAKYDLIKAKPSRTKREEEFIQIHPEFKLKQTLVSLLRPAMIVDGQHRVTGAYNSNQSPIMFNVCAISDADWVEQVFQFVVLNKTAKPISKSFLSGLLNTSLTNSEIYEIEERLETIGIKNMDRIFLRIVNYEPESPFKGMVSEPGEVVGIDNAGKLSDKGMIQLARGWHAISNNYNKLKMFNKILGVPRENYALAKTEWLKNKKWAECFFVFWKTIKDLYEPEGIWDKSDDLHLLKIVTLHELQNYFITTQQAAAVQFDSLEDFGNKVRVFFEPVKASFYRGWKRTGLQSGDGPEIIRSAMQELREGTRLSTVIKEHPLFQEY